MIEYKKLYSFFFKKFSRKRVKCNKCVKQRTKMGRKFCKKYDIKKIQKICRKKRGNRKKCENDYEKAKKRCRQTIYEACINTCKGNQYKT